MTLKQMTNKVYKDAKHWAKIGQWQNCDLAINQLENDGGSLTEKQKRAIKGAKQRPVIRGGKLSDDLP